MKLTNNIFNRQTSVTISKLIELPASKYKSMKIFFAIAKLKIEYDQVKKIFDYAETKLVIEYCDKDQNGKPIIGPKKEFFFSENRTEFQEKHDALMNQEIVLNLEPIVIKASEEEKLFKKEDICAKCREKYKDENHETIIPADVAALYGIIEFCE